MQFSVSRRTGVIAALLLLAAVLGGAAFMVSAFADRRVDLALRDERIKQSQADVDARDKRIHEILDDQARRDADAKEREIRFAAQLAQVQTAAQAAMMFNKALPAAGSSPAPIKVDPQPDSPSAVARRGGWLVTDEQLMEATRCGIREQDCAGKLAKAQEDVAARDKIIVEDKGKLADKDQQIKQEHDAARGGTLWQRTKRTMLPVICSGVGGGGGAAMDKKQPARGALIGALAGGTICAIARGGSK